MIPQAHTTDTVRNSPSTTLKIRVPSEEQLKPLFTTLACLYLGANPWSGHSFLHTRTQCVNQQHSNRTADQRFCFRYIDNTAPCTSLIRNSKFLAIIYGCRIRFVAMRLIYRRPFTHCARWPGCPFLTVLKHH